MLASFQSLPALVFAFSLHDQVQLCHITNQSYENVAKGLLEGTRWESWRLDLR